MAGISSKAATTLGNKYKYNGKEEQRQEFSDGSGLEWLDYGARMYDAQVGRWSGIDSKSGKYSSTSPYVYVLNRPTIAIDPDGREIFIITKNGGFLLAKNILLQTDLGKEIWNNYGNSKTHDVYIVSAKTVDNGDAAARTLTWDNSRKYIDSRLTKSELNVESFFNFDAMEDGERKDFAMLEGKLVRNPKRKISAISFSETSLAILMEYVGAEIIYHEFFAHIKSRTEGSTAEEDHNKYGIEDAPEREMGDYYYYEGSAAANIWMQIKALAEKREKLDKIELRDRIFQQQLLQKKDEKKEEKE